MNVNARERWKVFLGAGAATILIVQILYGLGVVWGLGSPGGAGTFGDMYGALNTFFTGLAFAAVVFTIYVQNSEAASARAEQAATMQLLQKQVTLLHDEVELQRQRDLVEGGPFFRLDDAGAGSGTMNLQMTNLGAPVICLDFRSITERCHVREWSPRALPGNVPFRATCTLDVPQPMKCEFTLQFRDRWGNVRTFGMTVDRRPSPAVLDFWPTDNAHVSPRLAG
jgi:hypothetical protein